MHVYFFAPLAARSQLKERYAGIKAAIRQADVYLSTNTETLEVQVSAEVLASSREENVPLLERMDAFIIEGTTPDPQAGFLLAHAIAAKKPTLYLYQRGHIPSIFSHLSRKELPSFIQVVAYHDVPDRAIAEFFRGVGGKKIKEIPRIKFTLRITSTIEAFLHFKTHNTETTKADYLRQAIERLMEADEEWQRHQRRRHDE